MLEQYTDEWQEFWKRVDPCRTDGCAVWLGPKSMGYGIFNFKRHRRLAYHFLVGRAPHGLEWDHVCRNKACVWPAHLEAVTHQENMRRRRHTEHRHWDWQEYVRSFPARR